MAIFTVLYGNYYLPHEEVKGLGGFQRLKTGTLLLFFLYIYPMQYLIQTVYHIKDTYLISTS